MSNPLESQFQAAKLVHWPTGLTYACDYTDGFSAANQPGAGTLVQGCSIADDFTALLGDAAEGRLAAMLVYRDTKTCPAATGVFQPGVSNRGTPLPVADGIVPKSPWLSNRIMQLP